MNAVTQNKPATRVVIFGGTHGNEMSGVSLVKHWLQDPSELHRVTFAAEPFLANPLAVEHCVRYIDTDLNRSFSQELLSACSSEGDPYEVKRAREIYKKFGAKESYDFVFDLHNTTSNMGSTLLLCKADDYLALHLANYLQCNCVDYSFPCNVYLVDVEERNNVYLQNIGKHSLSLELGPQPQGVTRADVLARMRELVNCSLDFLDLYNQGKEFPSFEMDIYRVTSRVDFPRDVDGEIEGFIHKELQDRDYHPLKPGDPIFQTLTGDEQSFDGEKVIYPTFINEAAYYEKKVAFIATEKVHQVVPALRVQC
ncbi:N-acyl-aromatic-L-amino acid amidohydrolase (carboxylate-forming)-like [Spea bombifrons]|uniref:N-acyl-aromatic-L-amino acid amidohydrolase (carboxylate-forming)-like n=1 Tax=Spea bombifrons TaxID=233779 RepID=UPI002349B115|nr:N-acyl-aromatic-L-amino acid amidohydrolase (carboxylate-forming)-like [Spea bombifrons]XP_053310824.1 N-acyl-aromatic-L-amino acid amidohydrolase (carboxylate-forming)-like [Spea bombifrons]